MKRKNPHIGSSFADFLDEEDILEECTNTAIKRVIARQVEQAMKQQGLSKAAMARQMGPAGPLWIAFSIRKMLPLPSARCNVPLRSHALVLSKEWSVRIWTS